jgi:hypothetical protein
MNIDPLKNFLSEAASTALRTGAEIVVAKNTPQKAQKEGTTPIPQSPVPAKEVDPLTTENKSNGAASALKYAPYLIYGGIIIVGGILIYRAFKK